MSLFTKNKKQAFPGYENVRYEYSLKIPEGILRKPDEPVDPYDSGKTPRIITSEEYQLQSRDSVIKLLLHPSSSVIDFDLANSEVKFHDYAVRGAFTGKHTIARLRKELYNALGQLENFDKAQELKEFKKLKKAYEEYDIAETMVSCLEPVTNDDAALFLKRQPNLIKATEGAKGRDYSGLPSTTTVKTLNELFAAFDYQKAKPETWLPGGLTNSTEFVNELEKIDSEHVAFNDLGCMVAAHTELRRNASVSGTITKTSELFSGRS